MCLARISFPGSVREWQISSESSWCAIILFANQNFKFPALCASRYLTDSSPFFSELLLTNAGHPPSPPLSPAEIFNNHFSTIGQKLASKFDSLPNDTLLPEAKETKLEFTPISKNTVMNLLKGMEAKLSTGHDGVSNKLLKEIAQEVAEPIMHIINHTLENGTFPEELKTAKVIPIFKKGAAGDANNYRPISLLPTISKLVEKVIDQELRSYMDDNSYWSDNQFGFRKYYETSHAVTKMLNIILEAKKKKEHTLAIFLDLKKAFDTVPHQRLIEKLCRYGIPHALLKSYLESRKQQTLIDNSYSSYETISCGVPQGSILGPTLFLFYVNDLGDYLNSNEYLLFADDTTFIFSAPTTKELIETTNRSLQKMCEWYKANKLTVHPGKTNFMSFLETNPSLYDGKILWENVPLERAGKGQKETTVKYVGIHIDEKLTFRPHAEHVHRKVSQNLHLISANKHYLPLSTRKLLYNALIRPYFNYGAEIWGINNQKRMFALQKKCIRHVVRTKNHISHTNIFFVHLHTPKFSDIVQANLCRLGFKLMHMKFPNSLYLDFCANKPTGERRRYDFVTVAPFLQKLKHLPLYSLAHAWNQLKENIKRPQMPEDMRKKLKFHFIAEYTKIPPCQTQSCPSCPSSRPSF